MPLVVFGALLLVLTAVELPFGRLTVAFDQDQMLWQGRRMTGFAPMAELRVFGLQSTYWRAPA